MKKNTKQILLICSIIFGLLLTASPFWVSYAQKKNETQKVENQNQIEQESKARLEVAKSAVGGIFLDKVTVKETRWKLKEAYYKIKDGEETPTRTVMSFGEGDNVVGINLSEYRNTKDAADPFYAPRSYGANVKFNTYGDEGEKLIGQNGDFLAIRFRKGNYFVSIFARDEKTAERFASYVAESIDDPKSK